MKYFKAVLIIALTCVSFSARASGEETFGTFAARLDSWADGLKGVVVSVSGKSADTDLGKNALVVKGMVFDVTRPGEELIHPVTGASLGRKTLTLGRLTVNGVYDNYSSASYDGEEKLIPGDAAVFPSPVPVKLVFSGLTDGEKAEASYAVLKSKKFIEAAESDYTVSCVKKSPEISEASCALVFKDGIRIVSAEVPVSSVVITTASNTVKKSGSENYKDGARIFGERFLSAAAGFAFGREAGLTVAAAEERAVTVFTYSESSGFEEAALIDGDFRGIINVELADLNGDGTDELFVSDMTGAGIVESKVYEYKNGAFRLLVPKTDYLFRTFYSGGKKNVICQRFAEGDFTGPVAPYIFKDGVYSAGPAYGRALGSRLYGFGETSAGEVSFNSNGGLTVKNPAGETSVYGRYFGDTPHKLRYTRQILKGVTTDKDGAEINNVENRLVAVSVYQRIIEIARGKFLLAGNVPVERKALGEDEYKSSFYGIYILFGGQPEPFWDVPSVSPAIAEMDAAFSGDKTYVLILKNFKNGFFSGSGSGMRIIAADVK